MLLKLSLGIIIIPVKQHLNFNYILSKIQQSNPYAEHLCGLALNGNTMSVAELELIFVV